MSTSFIYHALGLIGYHYVRTFYQKGHVIIAIEKASGRLLCPDCGSRNVIRRGTITRFIKTLPIGKRPIILKVNIQRLECRECQCIKQESLSFAEPKKSYSKALARYVIGLSACMTIQAIASLLEMSWDTIKDIQKAHLKKTYAKPKLKHLKWIAIDEISIGKNHRYLTVVLDLISGAVVFVGQGKSADALTPFWKRLRRSRAKIQAVAIDMSPAYIKAVRAHLPDATIVFDHFHVIKMFNDKLSQFRRYLYHKTKNFQYGEVLKGVRWLLLKNPENLSVDRNEKQRLQKALKLNEPLAIAYYLKEDLRQLWSQEHKQKAYEFLEHWINKARASGIGMLKTLANTMSMYRHEILNYYDYPISTGPLEGTNNKIKTMQRQAYGYRDQEFFMLKIFALHRTKYALIG